MFEEDLKQMKLNYTGKQEENKTESFAVGEWAALAQR